MLAAESKATRRNSSISSSIIAWSAKERRTTSRPLHSTMSLAPMQRNWMISSRCMLRSSQTSQEGQNVSRPEYGQSATKLSVSWAAPPQPTRCWLCSSKLYLARPDQETAQPSHSSFRSPREKWSIECESNVPRQSQLTFIQYVASAAA